MSPNGPAQSLVQGGAGTIQLGRVNRAIIGGLFCLSAWAEPAASQNLGAYVDAEGAYACPKLAALETWLGRPAGSLQGIDYGGASPWTWANYAASFKTEGASWAQCNPQRIVDWGVALALEPGQLQDVANGLYDRYFQTMAANIQAETPGAYVRLGWEMNGDWFTWGVGLSGKNAAGRTVTNTAAQYVAAFNHVAPLFRRYCPSCVMVWCPSEGSDNEAAIDFLPNSANYDVLGMDIYNTWEPSPLNTQNETLNWSYYITNYGMSYYNLPTMAALASRYNKPMAFPEFGEGWAVVGSGNSQIVDDPIWLNGLSSWARGHNIRYMGYWNSATAASGYLGIVYPTPPAAIPQTSAAFLADFGQ